MFTRTRWFTIGAATGAVAGAGGVMYGFVRLREAQGRLAPDRVAGSVVGAARTVGHGAWRAGGTVVVSVRDAVRDAVAEGREAMADAEARIVEDLDARRAG
ncbi:MAG TPA: hypothetical protein VMT43_06220 [Acidimicrobiales bacterium]|nr:hypothetical protein [Acidimicrobiales bacterium]